MIGAAMETVSEMGAGVVGGAWVKPRNGLSAADLEREFGSAIGELELGQGLRAAGAASCEATPAWARLFKFFQ